MLSFSEFESQPLMESNGLTIIAEVEKVAKRFLNVRPEETGGATKMKCAIVELDPSFNYNPNFKSTDLDGVESDLEGEIPESAYSVSYIYNPIFNLTIVTNAYSNRVSMLVFNVANPKHFEETAEAGNVVEFVSQVRRIIKRFLEISFYHKEEEDINFLDDDFLSIRYLYRKEEGRMALARQVKKWIHLKLTKRILREPIYRRFAPMFKRAVERLNIQLTLKK